MGTHMYVERNVSGTYEESLENGYVYVIILGVRFEAVCLDISVIL